MAGALILAPTVNVSAQNTLQFTGVSATSEKAIQLHWASNTNELYEIDYATSLIDTNTGATTWIKLYDNYPSQGTNTFIADSGNYDYVPEILHPINDSMRFYRVVMTGTTTSPTNPTVAVTFPTNGATLSGDVTFTVAASSPEFLNDVELFIDGEQQWFSGDRANFVVNTSEWPNGPHTIFAIARSSSGVEGFTGDNSMTYGSAASAYVNVNFNNLVSEFHLSEPYFEPSLGQTQIVTATFAANCNWTLQIQDANSNAVRTVTGSGTSLNFAWDGTGDGGIDIPDGIYSYQISAQTNGMAFSSMSLESSATRATMLSSVTDDSVTAPYIIDDSGNILPLAIYPPGFDTNGLIIVDATAADIQSLRPTPLRSVSASPMLMASTAQSNGQSYGANNSSSTSSSQTTKGPKRKPRVGVKNSSGSFGICYYTYPFHAFMQQPTTGWLYPLRQFTGTDGSGASSSYFEYPSLTSFKTISDGFVQVMKIGATQGSYKPAFVKGDTQWGAQDIKKPSKGGSSIFNTCNFGLLMTHGVYGTLSEDDNIKYTYLLLYDQKYGSSWTRLSDMDFGSTGKNGLRWMTILSCSMLYGPNVSSMANHSLLPDNENLHLLLGANTKTYASWDYGYLYASNLVQNVSIWTSLQNASTTAFNEAYAVPANQAKMTYPVTLRVMGYQTCIGDSMFQYNDPDPNSSYQMIDSTVFTP